MSDPSSSRPLATFTIPLSLTIRPAVRDDLRALEWHGLFTHDRALLRTMFRRHLHGECCILVAAARNSPVAQACIELPTADQHDRTGAVWGVRVHPLLQGHGIGTSLLLAAEALLRERGATAIEVESEPDNAGALALYEHLGYTRSERPAHRPAPGPFMHGLILLRKSLDPTPTQPREAA